jgi:hypothetical protein
VGEHAEEENEREDEGALHRANSEGAGANVEAAGAGGGMAGDELEED